MTAPVARCLIDPQPPFEPMTDWEEPVMTPGPILSQFML